MEDDAFYVKTKRTIGRGKAFLEQNFKTLGLRYIPSQANFILVKVPIPAQELYERMLRKGVIIRSMKSFGLDQFIRVNVGLPEENKKFLKALRQELQL